MSGGVRERCEEKKIACMATDKPRLPSTKLFFSLFVMVVEQNYCGFILKQEHSEGTSSFKLYFEYIFIFKLYIEERT